MRPDGVEEEEFFEEEVPLPKKKKKSGKNPEKKFLRKNSSGDRQKSGQTLYTESDPAEIDGDQKSSYFFF